MTPIAYVDEGVDYLTCSYRPDSRLTRLLFLISRVKREELSLNNFERKWGMSGYLGNKIGGLEYGHRHDGVCVRLVGPTAQKWWYRFAGLATNCSRVDIQQTVVMAEDFSRTIRRHFRQMRKHWQRCKQYPEPKEISGPFGPESLYSGDRSSETYLRAYHRGSKKGFEHCVGHVRFECELKGEKARRTLSELIANRRDRNYIPGLVMGHFQNRGCRLEWSRQSLTPIGCPRSPADLEKSLRWLAVAVRPTVERLIELNKDAEVLDALGLSNYGPRGPIIRKGE